MNVLITRPEKQAIILADAIRLDGHTPLIFSTLAIAKIPTDSLKDNTTYVIFTSANAVEYGYHLITKKYNYKIIAIGKITAKKLQDKNIKVTLFPKTNPSSKSLLEMPQMQNLKNENIVIVRGVSGIETLKETLENNNNISYKEVYKRIIATPKQTHTIAINTFLSNNKGVILITSVDNLVALLKLVNNNKILQYPVIALSNRIKKVVLYMGFIKCIVSKDISNNDIINSIKIIKI